MEDVVILEFIAWHYAAAVAVDFAIVERQSNSAMDSVG